jgi:TonB family protein
MVRNARKRPVLAPEDETRAIDALRFSLASDIVELVVLTADEIFLQTLREAVGASRRLWHVPSSDKVSDLLLAGGVGILVLDVQALHETGVLFITEIKRQFPDLVIVVAGNRESEGILARLVSDGTVYRFIHKPMSPARARLFADAAVKRFEEQRKRTGAAVASVAAPRSHGLWVGGTCMALCLLLGGIWLIRRGAHEESEPPRALDASASLKAAARAPPGVDNTLLGRAAQALAANQLTAPSGDNALELYLQELARNPANADARAGIAEVHERLLARAENALLEERLDEASGAIETARKAGVEGGRIAFLTSQLAKAREQLKTSADLARMKADAAKDEGHPAGQADTLATLAMERIKEEHLVDPDRDNARFYVQEALRADPKSGAAQEAEQALALSLLTAAHNAIDRRDFAHASSWLDAADGIAAPANIDNLRQALLAARREADTDAGAQLLKSAEERLQQDHLIEPENDSARYYLMTLRGVDPANAGLARLAQDVGARLVIKGRNALTLEQYEAARSWLDAAASIGYSSAEAAAARRDLDAALAQQKFLTNVVSSKELELVKSVQPAYPRKAEQSAIEGWVELDFTVTDTGAVKDVAVRAANPPGVFDQAAVGALLQWHYKPVLRDAAPVAQRARIRIRFALEQH